MSIFPQCVEKDLVPSGVLYRTYCTVCSLTVPGTGTHKGQGYSTCLVHRYRTWLVRTFTWFREPVQGTMVVQYRQVPTGTCTSTGTGTYLGTCVPGNYLNGKAFV